MKTHRENENRWPNLAAWLFSAAIASTVFSGNWRQLGLPGLVSPDRLLLLAAFVVLLIKDPARGERPYVRLTPTHVVLLVAAAFAICSAVVAGTIGDRSTIFPLVDRFGLAPFMLFLAGPVAFATDAQRRILLRTLLAVGAYIGLVAFFQGIGLRTLVFPRYIVDLSAEVQAGRARGPFLDAAINGVALFYCAIAAMVAYVTDPKIWAKRAALAVAALCLFDLIFTQERSVWIGAIAAILCAAAMAPALRRRLVVVGPLAIVAIVAGFVVIPGLYARTTERIGDQRTEWDRLNLDKAAENMILARPLFGFGLGTFTERSAPYFQQNPDFPLTNTNGELHNVFLSFASELGLVGTSIWLLGLVLAIGGAIAVRGPPELFPWRIGLLAAAVMWLIVANLTPMVQAFPNQLLWLWAGVVWPWRYAWVGSEPRVLNAGVPAQGLPSSP
jgi:O-antigen ligase